MINFDLLASLTAFGLIFYFYVKRERSRLIYGLPLPPGPKKLPFIGNLLDMPTSFEWETYRKWAREYDPDIIHVSVAGTTFFILNTAETVNDLFEKRSSIYSSRARMPMLNELMGWDFNFGFMAYGDYWRSCRRLFHQEFHPVASRRYHPMEIKVTRDLLRRLLNTPDDFMAHFRHVAVATVMSIAYGIDILPSSDPYVETVDRAVHPLVVAALPGSFLVDSIPWLKYVPEWLPGASFKRKAKEWKILAERMVDMPFQAAKRNIANGIGTPSFTSYCLEKVDEGQDVAHQEHVIQSTAGTMFTAGSDTTVSFMGSFFLAMLENPAAQAKAQQELDSVIGHGQLPDFNDRKSLPYITAIVKEVLRWRNITPIAVPHLLTTDDVYQGYGFPAGSIFIPNAWAILHDEKIYPDPFTFNPERFMKDGQLNPNIKDPASAAFGFGRRICPARYMAMDDVWITAASILATFDITKAKDDNGKIIEPAHDYISAIVCMPLPFKCSIKPRSAEAEARIRYTDNYVG